MNTHARCRPRRYSAAELLEIKQNGCHGIPRSLRRFLFILRVLCKCTHAHVTPATQMKAIPVRITNRNRTCHSHRSPYASLCASRPSASVSRRLHVLRPLPYAGRHVFHIKKPLNFGLLNVCSLHNKVDEVLDVISEFSLNVCLLVETWHDSDSTCIRRLRSEGFSVAERARPRLNNQSISTNHGGLVVICAPGIRLTTLHINCDVSSFEILCTRVTSGSSSCLVVLVYRTGIITSIFFSELNAVLDIFATYAESLILAGDFNIHMERSGDLFSRQLHDVCSSHGLVCHINQPTHVCGGTLDLVFSRSEFPSSSLSIVDPGLSDHFLLRWVSSLTRPLCDYATFTARPWSRLDLNVFRPLLAHSSLCDPGKWPELNCDELAGLYDSVLSHILDQIIPFRTVKKRLRSSDSWFDGECRQAKRELRRLERLVRRVLCFIDVDPSPLISQWRECKVLYRKYLKDKRESFWRAKVNSDCHKPRRLWRHFNDLLGRVSRQTCDSLSASDFMNYFISKVDLARACTANADPPSFSPSSADGYFREFSPVSVSTIAAAIRSLPNKHSACDPMPTNVLKDSLDLLLPFITYLMNKSLTDGHFPQLWKNVQITPILKRDNLDSCDTSSYRPISNLSVLSKLLERVVKKQLLDYLNSQCLFNPYQSAYRSNHSTDMALLKVTDDVLSAMDHGLLTLLGFLDLQSAFDSVDHGILLDRLLGTYGISGMAHNWFKSFVTGRTQFVKFRSFDSQSHAFPCGVPQGSVLGPIIFILYTQDIIPLVQNLGLNINVFADDIQVYGSCSPGDTSQLCVRLTSCISSVGSWLRSNRLLLNSNKTEFMWCSTRQRQRSVPSDPIVLDCHPIQPASSVRCLGVVFDCNLSFDAHITKTVSTCFGALRQLRSVRRCVASPLLLQLIRSLVLSRLDYCVVLLAGLPQTRLRRLQSVINASARLVFRLPGRCHISPFLRELGWLPISARIETRVATIVHHCLHGRAPDYLSMIITPASHLSGRTRLRSASSGNLQVPFMRLKTVSRRSFRAVAPRIWNSLPPCVTNSSDFDFKRALKEHFISISLT